VHISPHHFDAVRSLNQATLTDSYFKDKHG